MTRDEIHAKLEEIKNFLHEKFPSNQARLDQLDAHAATVGMVVDHLHDEASRAGEGN